MGKRLSEGFIERLETWKLPGFSIFGEQVVFPDDPDRAEPIQAPADERESRGVITRDDGAPVAMVVATNEERLIAEDTARIIEESA